MPSSLTDGAGAIRRLTWGTSTVAQKRVKGEPCGAETQKLVETKKVKTSGRLHDTIYVPGGTGEVEGEKKGVL